MIEGLATLLELRKQRWISYPDLQGQAKAVTNKALIASVTQKPIKTTPCCQLDHSIPSRYKFKEQSERSMLNKTVEHKTSHTHTHFRHKDQH